MKNIKLNDKEEEVMKILWRMEKAFIKEMMAQMPDPKPPYNTISSIMRKLDREGVVGHEPFGNTYRYYPILKEADYKRKSVKQIMDTYFGGSVEQLLSFFVKEKKIEVDDIAELLDKIKEEEESQD